MKEVNILSWNSMHDLDISNSKINVTLISDSPNEGELWQDASDILSSRQKKILIGLFGHL